MATVRTTPGSHDLATQNEELWRIIEKQRVVIQNIQKSLTLMTDERDNLMERNQDLEQELIMATQFNVEKEPVKREPSPKCSSPREVAHKEHQESKNLLADTIGAAMLGPVPPPRSPYRQMDNIPSPSSASSSTSNLGITPSVLERYGTPDSSETRMGATIVEPTLPATYAYDRPKAPPSPNPYRQADKSPRAAPSNGNANGPVDIPDSFSNTTLDLSLPPVEAMVERDAHAYPKYQGAHQRKDADPYQQHQKQQQYHENSHHHHNQQQQHHQQQQQQQYQYNEATTPSRKTGNEPHHPLSPVEYANGQQHNHHYQQPQQHNYQYQQQQQQQQTQRYQQTPQINQAQNDYHHRNTENNNFPKRPADDYAQQRHWQQADHARTTPAEEPVVPQSLTVATPTNAPSHHQQSPSSPQGTFSTGLMAGLNTKVIGSETITNDKGKEVIAFTISVRKAKNTKDPNSPLEEMWQVQKLYSDFLALDAQLKAQGNSVANKIAKLPDRALFATNVPSKEDQRKLAVENYLQHAIRLPLSDITDICEFLSSNVMEVVPQTPKVSKYRQGYLTKRGKNFGGWKRRYFMLDGPELKYYESEEGMFLGKIILTESQIGKQKAPENPKETPDFKHGLIILEPKKSAPGGMARHVLCADSDEERDVWVEAMTQHIDQEAVANRLEQSNKKNKKGGKVSKDDIKPVTDDRSRRSSYDSSDPNSQNRYLEKLLMGSTDSLHSNDDDSSKKEKGQRKAFWPKKMFAGSGNGNQNGQRGDKNKNGDWRKDQAPEPLGPNQVFGIPLEDAVKVAKVTDQYELPAIVYRCIDYLEAKNAILEEGIYRLSGSAVKIRNLKTKFNEDGDVNLLAADENYDIHAVSGLLKLWLRELPGNVLTTELLKEFLNVMDLVDRRERINELGRLVSMLPLQNYTLLRTLSAHLIRVVQNAGTNKMTIRNIGIVFSATLGIPAGIFSLLLTEFDYIFWTNDGSGHSGPPPISDDPASKFPVPPSTIPPPTQVPNNHSRVQALQRETGRSNRNSVNYRHGAPRSIVGLEELGSQGPIVDDGEEVDDLAIQYSDEDAPAYRTAERQPYVLPHQHHSNAPTSPPYPVVDPHHFASHYY